MQAGRIHSSRSTRQKIEVSTENFVTFRAVTRPERLGNNLTFFVHHDGKFEAGRTFVSTRVTSPFRIFRAS